MSRYNFTLTNDYECCLYAESTPEEDRMDVGIGGLTGNGYLQFWKRCREATDYSGLFGEATILDTYDGEEKVWHIDPPKERYTITFTSKEIMDSVGKGIDARTLNDIAIYLNRRFHNTIAEWVSEKIN